MSFDDILNYRQGMLLACAGALLHNLGKVSSQFIEGQLGILTGNYFYQHVPGLLLSDCSAWGPTVKDFLDHYRFDGTNKTPLARDLGGSNDKTGSALQPATKDLLKNTFVPPLSRHFDDRQYRVGDLIEYLGQGEPFYSKPKGCGRYLVEELFSASSLLTHLMNRSHHGASGGEKQDIYTLQQSLPLYLATPLGYEQPAPDTIRYDEIKKKVEDVVQKYLDPHNLQDPFPLGEFMRELERFMRQILGDTQRGLNDVTVWDIGHSGMAFLKAGIWTLTKRASLSHDDLNDGKNPNHPRWRLWRVGLNGLDFLTGAVSVADLRVRQRKLRSYLDRVRYFAEEVFPVATEIYRDENGGIYVFPDCDRNSGEFQTFERLYGYVFRNKPWAQTVPDEAQKSNEMKKAVEEKFQNGDVLSLSEIFGLCPANEVYDEKLHNHPECRRWSFQSPDTSPRYIGDKVREWIEKPVAAEPAPEAFTEVVQDDLCPYCGVRPIGGGGQLIGKLPEEEKRFFEPKARQRKTCRVCMAERGWVTQKWWREENFSTIWVDEVADANGRVALMVGEFGVEEMLQELVYPPDKAGLEGKYYCLVTVKVPKGSLPPSGQEFVCDNIRCKVLDQSEFQVLVGEKIEGFCEILKLVALDFSGTRRFTHMGRQPLHTSLEIAVEDVEYTGANYVLGCTSGFSEEIKRYCQQLTDPRFDWPSFQGLRCELEVGKKILCATVADSGRKLELEPSSDDVLESSFLWSDEDRKFYFYPQPRIREVGLDEFLKDWDKWAAKNVGLRAAPSASFARFRRVWETTARFWQEVAPLKDQVHKAQAREWQEALTNCEAVKVLGNKGTRRRLTLKLKLDQMGKAGGIAPYHAYELEVAGISIGIVPIGVEGNLHRHVRRCFLGAGPAPPRGRRKQKSPRQGDARVRPRQGRLRRCGDS